MTLQITRLKDGDKTLRIVKSYRRPDGKPTSTTFKILGRYSELLKEHEDPIAWGKEQARLYTDKEKKRIPLLPVPLDEELQLQRDEEDDEEENGEEYGPDSLIRNYGFAVFSFFYHLLEMDEFWKNRKKDYRGKKHHSFDLEAVFRLLVYNRLVDPSSKRGAWMTRKLYFDTGFDRLSLNNMYEALSTFAGYKEAFVEHTDTLVRNRIGGERAMLYYDVTNYYFEIDNNDPDTLDASGKVVKEGMRKKGCSKEHRTTPIVQLGLFIDSMGIPVNFDLFPGNTHDSKTLIPALSAMENRIRKGNTIIVADKGMMSGDNLRKIITMRNGYIISNSVRKADGQFRSYVLDEDGYTCYFDRQTGELEYKCKERTIPRKIKVTRYDEKTGEAIGKTSEIVNERQIVIWSRRYAAREKLERAKVLTKTEKLVGSHSDDANVLLFGSRKYIKKTPVKNGKVVIPDDYILELDEARVDKEEALDGYYFISTNVVGFDPQDKKSREKDPASYRYFLEHAESDCYFRKSDGFFVLKASESPELIMDKYHELWRIEETFRVTKSFLDGRPVFVSLEDHITAHFLICYAALVIMRVIQYRLGWKYSARRIQKEVRKLVCVRGIQNFYECGRRTKLSDRLFELAGLEFKLKRYSHGDLRSMIAKTKNC